MAFQENDLVFGKIKGYPYWPGKVISVDDETYKHVTKFEVKFFGTYETAKLSKNDLCPFIVNKLKYTLEKVASKHKDAYYVALNEIGKAWEENKPLNKSLNLIAKQNKTPNSTRSSVSDVLHSNLTPLSSISFQATSSRTKTTLNSSSSTKDAAVGTPIELDLNFKIHALTEKCISLEMSLIEEKNRTLKLTMNKNKTEASDSEDFHTQILKQQLKDLKTENANLLTVVEVLRNDYNKLQQEMDESNKLKCLHCFPHLHIPSLENSWKSANACTRLTNKQEGISVQCSNRFSVLTHDVPSDSNDLNSPKITKKHQLHKTTNKSKAKPSDPKLKSEKVKLVILSDSHGKHLSNLIERKSHADVCSYVRSGARFNKVTEEVMELSNDLGKRDYLLVIGGTNDMETMDTKQLIDDVNRIISCTKHTNLILASIPMRHGEPSLDINISSFNNVIEETVRTNGINLLPLHLLPRHHYTRHGLHFNKRGKENIANLVSNMIALNMQARSTSTSKCSRKFDEDGVNFLEADMYDIIDQLKNDPSVGFSHTISADFTHHRHMSAGVAVAFRHGFGRPQNADYVNTKLTLQSVENGAYVYSLVTKKDYFGKPTEEDYNTAFTQLTQDFKKRGLKTLICSPMGCVRDLIQPGHFIEKIVEFQRETTSAVYIVSCDQVSKRILRCGLPHPEFLEKLRGLLANHSEAWASQLESSPHLSSSPTLELPVAVREICVNDTPLLHSSAFSQTFSTPSLSGFPSPTTPPMLCPNKHIGSSSPIQKNLSKSKVVNPI